MLSTYKTFAIAGVLAAGLFAATPARADNFSLGVGFSVAPTYRSYAPPVYYRPSYGPQVTYYSAPAYSYPAAGYAAPYYYAPQPTVVYAAPQYYAPQPY